MSVTSSENPIVDGIWFRPLILSATSAQTSGTNTIAPTTKTAEVTANVNDANDFVVLPALSTVPNGHEVTILGNSTADFEVRTPSASAEKINNVDSDGSAEYLFTDGEIHRFVKVSNSQGWIAYGFTNLGAVATAVVPD